MIFLRYLQGVGIIPSQPVAVSTEESLPASPPEISSRPTSSSLPPSRLLEELWQQCDASAYQLTRGEFEQILTGFAQRHNYGQPDGATPSSEQQGAFLRNLKLSELVLAQACAAGNEHAWEHFFALYRGPLTRAAIAITRSETLGGELADALYAELYGLTIRDGERRSPLSSYHGRGSLMGWLRTILAQRHVDHHRRTGRDQSLEEEQSGFDLPAAEPTPASAELDLLSKSIAEALRAQEPEERFLLASYYLDQRTLLQISRVLHVHEATVSRKLRRIVERLRKEVLHHLQTHGLSKRAAEEALGADPRDLTGGNLELNLRKLLQTSLPDAFQEKAGL